MDLLREARLVQDLGYVEPSGMSGSECAAAVRYGNCLVSSVHVVPDSGLPRYI
jgi:hypothetical protein